MIFRKDCFFLNINFCRFLTQIWHDGPILVKNAAYGCTPYSYGGGTYSYGAVLSFLSIIFYVLRTNISDEANSFGCIPYSFGGTPYSLEGATYSFGDVLSFFLIISYVLRTNKSDEAYSFGAGTNSFGVKCTLSHAR